MLLGSVQRTKIQQLLHEYIWDVHIRQAQNSNSSSLSSSHQSLCDFHVGGATTPPLPALEEDDEADEVILPAITRRMSESHTGLESSVHNEDPHDDFIPPRPSSVMSLQRRGSVDAHHQQLRPVLTRQTSGPDLHHVHKHNSLPRRFSMVERSGGASFHPSLPSRQQLRRSSSANSIVTPRLANERLIQSARQSIT